MNTLTPLEVFLELRPEQRNRENDNYWFTKEGIKTEVRHRIVSFCLLPQDSVQDELDIVNRIINPDEVVWLRFRDINFEGGWREFKIVNPFSNFSL